jgi:hypothetical protein
MRISEKAMTLLNENKIAELQALPLEALLHPDDYLEYRRRHNALPVKIPVVVSNGRIYSESTIKRLLKDSGKFQCLITGDVLRKDCFGPEGAEQSYVRLPQIEAAQIKKVKATAVFAFPLDAAEAKLDPTKTSREGKIDTAASTLTKSSGMYKLRVLVAGSKVRILITGETGSNLDLLTPYFEAAFAHSPKARVASDVTSYSITGYGCCWRVKPIDEARLEFWFPCEHKYRLKDDEFNVLTTALLSSLKLPEGEIPPGTVWGSIAELEPRDYKDAIIPVIVSLAQIKKCCDDFMTTVQKIADDRHILLNNVVDDLTAGPLPSAATLSGMMLFGRPYAAGGAGAAAGGAGTSTLAIVDLASPLRRGP